MSLIYLAPIISSAQVSEARTYDPFNDPKTSGRIPKGSLTPISFLFVKITNEYAPLILFKASINLFTSFFLS